jgi:MSHA biogenesis protein MshJ
MKLELASIENAWQALQRREQWLLCVAALVVPLLLADTLVWNPWRLQTKALTARVAQADQELQQLGAAQAGLLPRDGSAARQAGQIESLRRRLVQAEQAAQAARRQVVTPQQMAATLREITESRGAAGPAGHVTVVALRSLPVTPVAEPGASTRLYRHTFELQVEGSYADIARYVEHLELSAGALRWNALELDASRHPTVAARLEVFTLSEQSSWIQL